MGAKVAKHAPNPQVGDGVTILFDTPFANGDDPAKVSYELVRAGFKTGIKKTRADGTERVDDRHVALYFEGLKKGVYSLLRTDERGTPATIFSNVPYNPDGQPASKLDTGLTRGKAVRPTGVQGTYWTWTDVPPNPPNLDPDLKYDLTDLKDAIDSHEPKKPTWKAVKDEDRIKVPDVKDEHYAEACAVFTRPVSFVEWKTYAIPVGENDKKRWFPFGISRDKEDGYRDRAKASAWKELGNERYIYVSAGRPQRRRRAQRRPPGRGDRSPHDHSLPARLCLRSGERLHRLLRRQEPAPGQGHARAGLEDHNRRGRQAL